MIWKILFQITLRYVKHVCVLQKRCLTKCLNIFLKLCVDSGLVDGTSQSVDSAYISANASFVRMEQVKLVDRDHDEYLKEVFDQDLPSVINSIKESTS